MVNIMFGAHWAKAAEGLKKSANSESKTDQTKTAFTLNQIVEGNSVIYFL